MQTYADSIREYARSNYIEPARLRGEQTVRIVAGDVQRALKLTNRTPAICQALSSKIFLDENHVHLEKREGPPSGLSTTVAFTYRIDTDRKPQDTLAALKALRGIGKDIYAQFGGGEEYLRREREEFYGDQRDRN